MTQQYHVSGFNKPVGTDDGWTYIDKLAKAIETIRTCYRGSSDPSVGASPAWGISELGTIWIDETDTIQTVVKQWSKLDNVPTYGWRTLRVPKVIWLTTPSAWTFAPASPAGADVAFTAQSPATQLNGLQDVGQTTHLVIAVYVEVKWRTGVSETIPTTDDCYFALRTTGGTNEHRFYPQVQNRFLTDRLWLPLSAGEQFDFKVDVGGGTPAFEYAMNIHGLMEVAF